MVENSVITKPILKLVGENGNAFNILGKAIRVAKQSGWNKEKIEEFKTKAMEGNYDNLLNTCMEYFEVE